MNKRVTSNPEGDITTEVFKLPGPIPRKFVAFLDVLGFSELVKGSRNSELEKYFQTITDILIGMREHDSGIQCLSISDSIILISPDGLNGLKLIIKAVRTIQRKLLWKNILLRGAISYGEVYFDEHRNVIVGKGYIRAFKLEGEAIYPRVIIDPNILQIVNTDRVGFLKAINGGDEYAPTRRHIYVHDDSFPLPNDAIFVDYAYALTTGKISQIIKRVHTNIKKNLYSEQHLYSKYIWLKDYYLTCLHRSLTETEDKNKVRVLSEWITKFSRL